MSNKYIDKLITMGKDFFISARVLTLKCVNIGDGAVVGAGSVGMRVVSPRTIGAGSPAQCVEIV